MFPVFSKQEFLFCVILLNVLPGYYSKILCQPGEPDCFKKLAYSTADVQRNKGKKPIMLNALPSDHNIEVFEVVPFVLALFWKKLKPTSGCSGGACGGSSWSYSESEERTRVQNSGSPSLGSSSGSHSGKYFSDFAPSSGCGGGTCGGGSSSGSHNGGFSKKSGCSSGGCGGGYSSGSHSSEYFSDFAPSSGCSGGTCGGGSSSGSHYGSFTKMYQ